MGHSRGLRAIAERSLSFRRLDARRIDFLAYLLGLVLGAALLLASGFVDRSFEGVRQSDFAQFWVGPRAVLLGSDPYDPKTWHETAIALGGWRTDTPVYGYFGWAVVLLLPLAVIDLDLASTIWLFGGLALAAVAMRSLLATYLPGLPVAHTLVALTLTASHPARLTALLGQWGFLLLAALAATVMWLRAGRSIPAAAAAVLMLVKPQLFLLTAPALGAWSWMNHKRVFLAAWFAMATILVLASMTLLPQWPEAWLREMPSQRVFDPPRTTTLATVLYGWLGSPGTWIAFAIIGAGVLVAIRFAVRTDESLASWLALSAVAAPYTWSYDHILLLVPLVVASGVVLHHSRRAAFAMVVAGALIFLPITTVFAVVAAARNQESYSAIVAVALVVLIIGPLWRYRPASASLRASLPAA